MANDASQEKCQENFAHARTDVLHEMFSFWTKLNEWNFEHSARIFLMTIPSSRGCHKKQREEPDITIYIIDQCTHTHTLLISRRKFHWTISLLARWCFKFNKHCIYLWVFTTFFCDFNFCKCHADDLDWKFIYIAWFWSRTPHF